MTTLRDHYLAALGITQWVSLNSGHAPDPIISSNTWRKLNPGPYSQIFAFIVEEPEAHLDLLYKIIAAIQQTPAETLIYTSAVEKPDGLPVVAAQHVILLGYGGLQAYVPDVYHCAPSLLQLSQDVNAKRALWGTMKCMLSTHA